MSRKNILQSTDESSELPDEESQFAAVQQLDWSGNPDTELSVRFQPMWDTKLNAVSTFLAIPCISNENGVITGRRSVLFAMPHFKHQTLDDQMFEASTNGIEKLLSEGQRALVCLPIHFDSLSSASTRHTVVEKFKALDQSIRDHIVVEIVGLLNGVPTTRLIDITLALKQLVRSVIIQSSVNDRNFSTYKDSGIKICGLEMAGRPADETKTVKVLSTFAELAQKAGLQTYLHGSPSSSVTIAALAAGFTYISGDPIASLSDLKAVERFSLRDFYRQSTRED